MALSEQSTCSPLMPFQAEELTRRILLAQRPPIAQSESEDEDDDWDDYEDRDVGDGRGGPLVSGSIARENGVGEGEVEGGERDNYEAPVERGDERRPVRGRGRPPSAGRKMISQPTQERRDLEEEEDGEVPEDMGDDSEEDDDGFDENDE